MTDHQEENLKAMLKKFNLYAWSCNACGYKKIIKQPKMKCPRCEPKRKK